MSPPAKRTWSPGRAGCSTRTGRRRSSASALRSVCSTITIASAPSGIGAPVMIRIASPGADGRRRRPPGRQLADDPQRDRRRVGRAGGVGGPHGVPVHRGVRERRDRLGRDDVGGEHEPERVDGRDPARRQAPRCPRARAPARRRAGSPRSQVVLAHHIAQHLGDRRRACRAASSASSTLARRKPSFWPMSWRPSTKSRP